MNKPDNADTSLITSKDLLEQTGISRATLNNYIKDGIIPRPLVKGEFPVRLRSEKNVTGAWPGGIVFPPDIPVAAPQAVIDLKYWGEQAHQESLMGKPAW